jgi:DNA-binding response OmpR family regulator
MFSRGNILVVDDEINLCRILDAKLSRSGYEVMTVHDGLQAVEKVRERRFDLVLLDLILPKLGGLEALERIRKIDSDLPVIVMTACENSDALTRAQDQGVAAFVSKPFDLDRLVHLVQTASAGGRTASEESEVLEPSGIFQPHQKAEVEPEDGGPRLSATVMARSGSLLHLALPEGSPRLDAGTAVRVSVATGGALYRFTGTLNPEGENGRATVSIPPVIHRVQRRRCPRLEIAVPATLIAEGRRIQGEIRNIGAGGACLQIENPLEPGTEGRVLAGRLLAFDQFQRDGRVLRCEPVGTLDATEAFQVALQFSEPDPELQRAVVKQLSEAGRLSS